MILDCCHAELGHRANYVFQSADLAEAYPVDGLYFIGASGRDAKAKAPADGGLTYFTDAFVTTVTAGIPRRPPTLRLDQIFLELRARLLRANLPEPVEAGTRGAHQFPFAHNAAALEPIDEADADITRLRHEKTEAQERVPREEHARRPQRLDARLSRTAYPTGTTAPEHPAAPTPPSIAITGTAYPYPAELWPVLSRRSLLITAAVAALGTGIGGAVWALNAKTPALPPAEALGSPLAGFTGSADSVAFGPDRHTLAAASSGDGVTVRLWNVTHPAHPVSLGPPLAASSKNADSAGLNSVAFSPDGRTLAAIGDYGATVWLWDVADLTHPAALGPPVTGLSSGDPVALSPDGRTLAAIGNDGVTVRLWNVTHPAHPVSLGSFTTNFNAQFLISSVMFSPNGHTLAAACGVSNFETSDGSVQLWNVTDPAHPVSLGQPFAPDVLSVMFSPNGHTLAAISADGIGNTSDYNVDLWNLTDPAHPVFLASPLIGGSADTNTSLAFDVNSVAFSPDGHTLAAAGGNGTVRLWDITDPAYPESLGSPLTGFDASAVSVAFGPNSHILAAGGGDGTVRLWALH